MELVEEEEKIELTEDRDLTEEEKENLWESYQNLNFLAEDMMEEIKRVEIFYEDCDNCADKDECKGVKKFYKQGMLLEALHNHLRKNGVDSTLHALTTEDRGEAGKKVSEEGGVLPVGACFDLDVPLFIPRHNYFYIEMEDGRRLLYMIKTDLFVEGDESERDRMIYR